MATNLDTSKVSQMLGRAGGGAVSRVVEARDMTTIEKINDAEFRFTLVTDGTSFKLPLKGDLFRFEGDSYTIKEVEPIESSEGLVYRLMVE